MTASTKTTSNVGIGRDFDFENTVNGYAVSKVPGGASSVDAERRNNKIIGEINNSLGAVTTELRGLVEAKVPELKGVNVSSLDGKGYMALLGKIEAQFPGAGQSVMRSLNYASDTRPIGGKTYSEIATIEAKHAVNLVSGQVKYSDLPKEKLDQLASTRLQYSSNAHLADAPATNGGAQSKNNAANKAGEKKKEEEKKTQEAPKATEPVAGVKTDSFDKSAKTFLANRVYAEGDHDPSKAKQNLTDQEKAQAKMAQEVNGMLYQMEKLPLGELSKLSPEAQAAVTEFQATITPKVEALNKATAAYEKDLLDRQEAEEEFIAGLEKKIETDLAAARGEVNGRKLAYEEMEAAFGGETLTEREKTALATVKQKYDDAVKALADKEKAATELIKTEQEKFDKQWNDKLNASLGKVYDARTELHKALGPIDKENGKIVVNEYGHVSFPAYNKLMDGVFAGADKDTRIAYTMNNWNGGETVPTASADQAKFEAAPSTQEYLKVQQKYEAELDKIKDSVRPEIKAAIEKREAYSGNTENLTAQEKRVVETLDNLYKPVDITLVDEKTRLSTTLHFDSKLEAMAAIYYTAKLPHHMNRDKNVTEETMKLRDGMFKNQNPDVGPKGVGGTSDYGPKVFNDILAAIPADKNSAKEGWSLDTMNKLIDSQFALTTGVGRGKTFGQNLQVASSPHKIGQFILEVAAGALITRAIGLAASGLFGRRGGRGKPNEDKPNDE